MNPAVQSKGGGSGFLARLEERHRVWAFGAVEAHPGMVSGALADEIGQAVFFENAKFRAPAEEQQGSAPEIPAADWVAVVRPKEGPWTVFFLVQAPRAPHYLSRLFPLTQELAETLGVRAFATSRDEAGEVECRLYDNENLVEEAVFLPGEPFRRFRSSRRETPAPAPVELAFVGELCAGIGLSVPSGHAAIRADEVFFAVEDGLELERVDLLLPPAPAEETMVFEEDETVIFQAAELEAPAGAAASEAAPKAAEKPAGWGMKALLGRLFGSRG